jgi:N-6 DNA Methylase/TaqI-like C-terminal specificity domain
MLQLSLFGGRPLFLPDLRRRFLSDRSDTVLSERHAAGALRDFNAFVASPAGKRTTEPSLEQGFNDVFFSRFLGYELLPGTAGYWSFWPKPPQSVTKLSGEPDGALGHFNADGATFEPLAIVELKRPGTSLDAPQASHGGLSPVEQAFEYAKELPSCRWVIVSDMSILRLYSTDSQGAYEPFDLSAAVQEYGQRLEPLAEIFVFLSKLSLIDGGDDSIITRLYRSSQQEQTTAETSFYDAYTRIRSDIISSISVWNRSQDHRYTEEQIIFAAQRLLDRILFIFYCEDHPDRLLLSKILEGVVQGALRMPGSSRTKVYTQIKLLFRDLDVGADTGHWKIPKYNGELFKFDPILDSLELNDELATRVYATPSKRVVGVWGLHVFDYWRELDRDLLGNIFEKSIGDVTAIAAGGRPDARAAFGVFYTASRIAKFVSQSVVGQCLGERNDLMAALEEVAQGTTNSLKEAGTEKVLEAISSLRTADLTCGSGVFLVAALEALLRPYRKALEAQFRSGSLLPRVGASQQSQILKHCIYGADRLPAAVELAKLALWLTAARHNEPSADLSSNFFACDTLSANQRAVLTQKGPFDVIVGNPPWGGVVDDLSDAEAVIREAGLDSDADSWDTWELFVLLAYSQLKRGGRLALLLPDTLLSPEKQKIRSFILEKMTVEKLYLMGPDWFGATVRMSTIILQAKKAEFPEGHHISTLVLTGEYRRKCQAGLIPLEQAEVALQLRSAQSRSLSAPDRQFQVFCSEDDWALMDRMMKRSHSLSSLTVRARGDEISADGLLWKCPNCSGHTVPGERQRGGNYNNKLCPHCGATLSPNVVTAERIVSDANVGAFKTPYIDGNSLIHRYDNPHRRFMRTDLIALKNESIFLGPKILVRQAGIGLTATLCLDNSRCPQSIYIYRLSGQASEAGYTIEFILAALVSRTMNYFVLKRFSETDPARAFAKLTHERLASLPIPAVATDSDRNNVIRVSDLVRGLLNTHDLGGAADFQIELALRAMWGISPDEGAYINGSFSLVPFGQAVRDLFPDGPPRNVPFPL